MTVRFAIISVLCASVYLAPLAAHPDRALHPAPWFGLAVALVIMFSQPLIDLRESASRSSADRGSALGILGSMIAAQLAAAIDFAGGPPVASGLPFVIGAAVAVFGLALRLWAICTLGRFFTSLVHVVNGQTLIRSGPYCWLRHPSYTGALLAAFGTAVALGSHLGASLVLALCVPAYLYRIHAEERFLVGQLGEAYLAYRDQTWGLVPGLR